MRDSNYTKIFTGSLVITQHIIQELEENGINAIVKDETESARLGGFGGGIVPGFQEIFVNNDELDEAITIVEKIKAEMAED
ncbi:putative signal transducing protein [Aestuariivivens sp. NBU2969]|uniref:putative signal transducing protein n=1 Tax=Aestuariivivens sp. NBU2969 TaxID=2873267 RepID=UPI001CBDF1F0|nr:DUF2007 domain-containing protein [Aestuariivivens sp. NBU2969]